MPVSVLSKIGLEKLFKNARSAYVSEWDFFLSF